MSGCVACCYDYLWLGLLICVGLVFSSLCVLMVIGDALL